MKSFPLYVGLRYLRASKGSGFISFVTVASVTGVALGVATLIVVLSVMNGFENELRQRLLSLTAHAAITESDGLADWENVSAGLEQQDAIAGVAPYIELEGMLSGPAGYAGGLITGIDPAREIAVSTVHENMLLGDLDSLNDASGNMILGAALARSLGVSLGDRISLLVPQPAGAEGAIESSLESFTVSGMFELGVQNHDSVRALISLQDAARIGSLDDAVSGVRVMTDDIFAAPVSVRRALRNIAPDTDTRVRDWTEENASYFRAIRIEKLMMTLLLSLIIGVAAFNIVASLVMVVTEKRSGIAILRTIGCSRADIVRIFVLQGTLVGWIGALLGIALGIALTLNIGTLAPALEQAFGFQFMPADLYYLTDLPAELRLADVLWTAGIVLIITALATVYPSLRAASVEAAEVLRYE